MRQFSQFCGAISDLAGRPLSFVIACILIAAWCFSGPHFNYSDTWQLVINTSTTIITFLMVFLIQNTQNRESKAMQLKLDELIRSIEGAHNAMLNLEELTTDEIAGVHQHYKKIAHQARRDLIDGKVDTGTPQTYISPADITNEAILQHDGESAAIDC